MSRCRPVTHQDAYTYALRVAYLSYLLQPRARRLQHVAAPSPAVHRSSTSINDLVKDFALVRDSKSTRFPHGFMTELDKRITGVLIGKERMPEYGDSLVKRSFAAFLNAFKEAHFRKSMEKDRRVEDLLLIFFSNATKEMQKGKAPNDDNWKLMVDRHVALFVRLISSTLKEHDWTRDRPELTSKLQILEKKLLAHDQDLAAVSQRNGGAGGSTIEVEVPRSYEVKDMPLVLVVSRIFGVSYAQAQADITQNKSVWTEKAALQDLKKYQANLSLNNRKTLKSEDFDLQDAYEAWKKAEIPDLSQMMLAVIQSNPELAKSTTGGNLPYIASSPTSSSSPAYSDLSWKSDPSDSGSSYVVDQPVDMSALSLRDDSSRKADDDGNPYMYIPPDPRAFYRSVLRDALTYDLNDQPSSPTDATADPPPPKLLSKQSADLLNEIGYRWRLPQSSRLVLFLDVIQEKYQDQEIDLEVVDAAFNYVNEPPVDIKKSSRMSQVIQISLFDRTKWTIADYTLNQQVLSTLHDSILRELYELMQGCYGKDPPPIANAMYVLDTHIYGDPLFQASQEELDRFADQLKKSLSQRAADLYRQHLAKEIPDTKEEWEFFHVISLGKAVVKLCQKIQKRYKKTPEILG